METKAKKLRNYFFENLSAAEAEEIELQLLSDTDLAGELDAAETELMEDYLEGVLSADERGLFEKSFLITPERRKRLEFLRILKNYAGTVSTPSSGKLTTPGFFESVMAFWNSYKLALGACLAIMVLFVGLFWTTYWPAGTGDPEIAALNQQDFSNPEQFKDLTNVTLVSGNLRSGGSENNFDSGKLAGNIFFRLALLTPMPTDSTFQVRFRRSGNDVITLKKVRPYRNTAGEEVRLLVPARLLTKGEYQIELANETRPEIKAIYNFTIR